MLTYVFPLYYKRVLKKRPKLNYSPFIFNHLLNKKSKIFFATQVLPQHHNVSLIQWELDNKLIDNYKANSKKKGEMTELKRKKLVNI